MSVTHGIRDGLERPTEALNDRALGVQLKGIRKRFGTVVAIDNLSLSIVPGEFFSLLGPSGCGKSTLLRLIGGFEETEQGQILIGGRDMGGLPAQRRPTAMVFQNYALFPTMTVGENVAYGLHVRKYSKRDRTKKIAEALGRVNLPGYENKPVTQLSGGQQQRVAVARALAVQPEVLLFDEPLSNLDVALRERTRRSLKELHQRLGTTMIYVTHDQQEALALSDRIAVMRAGRIQQIGAPEHLYRKPETAFVAGFLGGSNIVRDPEVILAMTGRERLHDDKVLSVRPEHFILDETGSLTARIETRQFLGTYVELWITIGTETVRAWFDPSIALTSPLNLRVTNCRWVLDDIGVISP